uniref:Uncharacterized protein n=1 Tax=Zea mays TaxID=4577 RepID=A0A804QAS5_MAIZE
MSCRLPSSSPAPLEAASSALISFPDASLSPSVLCWSVSSPYPTFLAPWPPRLKSLAPLRRSAHLPTATLPWRVPTSCFSSLCHLPWHPSPNAELPTRPRPWWLSSPSFLFYRSSSPIRRPHLKPIQPLYSPLSPIPLLLAHGELTPCASRVRHSLSSTSLHGCLVVDLCSSYLSGKSQDLVEKKHSSI